MKKFNGSAVLVFVLGIIGILGFFLASYAAVGFGIFSVIEIHREKWGGMWMAIVGLVLGALGVIANVGHHFFSL